MTHQKGEPGQSPRLETPGNTCKHLAKGRGFLVVFSNQEEVDPGDDETVCCFYVSVWFSFKDSYQLEGNGGFMVQTVSRVSFNLLMGEPCTVPQSLSRPHHDGWDKPQKGAKPSSTFHPYLVHGPSLTVNPGLSP